MSISQVDLKRLEAIYQKWCHIQGEVKRAEQISQLAVIPAINELRYAGRVLVACLAQESTKVDLVENSNDNELEGKTFSERLTIADQYLDNADNDISDALIYFFQKRVDAINKRFGAAKVIERYPKYSKISDNLQNARELIIESRSDMKKRKENYISVKNICSELIDLYFDLEKSEVYSAIEITKFKSKEKKLMLGFTLMSIVSAVLLFLVLN